MTAITTSPRSRQRGSAMLVTMVVVVALLAGAGVLVSMQLASTRSSDMSRTGLESMYCAEAGLAAAQPVVAANYPLWNSALTLPGVVGTEPSWLVSGIGSHSVDGGSGSDFLVYLRDNDDELAPATNNPLLDSDLRVFIVSRCLKYGESVQEVEELVTFSGGGACYQSQQGGCGGNGNSN